MNTKAQSVIVASLLTATVVGAVFVSRAGKDDCVIPKCDSTQVPVDCKRSVTPPFSIQGTPKVAMWLGCNVMPKKDSVGKDCIPSVCTIKAGEQSP